MLPLVDAAARLRSNTVLRGITSIFIPGFLLLAEVALLVASCNTPMSLPRVVHDIAFLDAGGPVVSVLLLVLVGCGAYVLGFCGRALGFRIAGYLHRFRRVPLREVRKSLCDVFGSENVDAALREHFLAAAVSPHEDSPLHARADDVIPEGDFDTLRGHVFWYCKTWLRIRSPRLAVDHLETEVNAAYALIVPLLGVVFVAGGAAARADTWSTELLATCAGASALALLGAWTLLKGAARRQETEHWEALRNLLLAEWLESAANREKVAAPMD